MHPALPRTVTLRRWRSVHDLDASTRVIGLDPDGALVVGDLAPQLATLLDDLRAPLAPAEFAARAVARGLPGENALVLLRALYAAGELVDGGARHRIAAHRARAAVVVVGTGPLAAGLVIGLGAAGVGGVHLVTSGKVEGADLGTGLTDADRGRPRLVAVADAAARAGLQRPLSAWPRTLTPDLVVLADEAPDPVRIADLRAASVAHLAVRLRDGVGVVGPLVLPGRTACLDCLDVARTANEPRWPMLAARIAGRRGAADHACVVATAGLGVAQALDAVDASAGGVAPPATLETTLELDVTAATIVRRHWRAEPGCTCRAADPTRGTTPGRATIEG